MFTDAEIAAMESEDGEHLMPLVIRRHMADAMREQNATEKRWAQAEGDA